MPEEDADAALPDVGPNGSSLSVPSKPGRLSTAYDVQKPVGKGGYAIVYKGVRREDGRIVAVKKVEVRGPRMVCRTLPPCDCMLACRFLR